MKTSRTGILLGVAVLLGLSYAWLFTEWLQPEPIAIVAQFRPLPKAIADRRKASQPPANAEGAGPRPEGARGPRGEASGRPPGGRATNAPANPGAAGRGGGLGLRGGALAAAGRGFRDIQPFVFSLDAKYRLTSIKVVESSSTNPTPPIAWWVRSRSGSPPTDAILYGRAPEGLEPMTPGSRPDKLLPGRTYTLWVEAGRRRGQQRFSVPQEAEPLPPEDDSYHPEKDTR